MLAHALWAWEEKIRLRLFSLFVEIVERQPGPRPGAFHQPTRRGKCQISCPKIFPTEAYIRGDEIIRREMLNISIGRDRCDTTIKDRRNADITFCINSQ